MRLTSHRHIAALVVSAGLLVGAAKTPSPIQDWEVGGAQIQLSRVMMLAERISKQNLLYQLHLAEVRKADIVETAGEIDKALRVLYEGSGTVGVPKPPTPEIRKQIDRVDEQWGRIRPMALASPYDYARRSGTTAAGRRDDPLLVRLFESRVSKMIEQAYAAQELYHEICVEHELPACEAMRGGPATTVLAERLLKEAIFAYANIEPERYRASVEKTRAQLASALEPKDEAEVVVRVRSPERGTAGRVVAGMRRDIDAYWKTLVAQVDRVLAGQSDEFDLLRALSTQRQLVFEYQRYTIAIVRFGAEQRARQAAAGRN